MGFEPLTPEEMEKHGIVCTSPYHNPPVMTTIVTDTPRAWVCPACGKRTVVTPGQWLLTMPSITSSG